MLRHVPSYHVDVALMVVGGLEALPARKHLTNVGARTCSALCNVAARSGTRYETSHSRKHSVTS